MNTVKNLHYLSGYLPKEKTGELEQGASLYQRHANITFKILKANKDELIVEVRQGRNAQGKYLSSKDLTARANELFSRFFPDRDIHTRPKPYHSPPPDEVSPEWVQDHMNRQKVSLKKLEKNTGIDKTNLSAWVNGTRPMSQPVKAMFYFLFKGRQLS